MAIRFIAVIVTSLLSLNAEVFFKPPEGWLLSNPEKTSSTVQAAFVSPQKKSGIIPSINFAIEPTKCSLKEYLNVVKKNHLSKPKTSWREIGTLQTQAGKAILTQVDTTNQWGPVRLMQLFFLHDNNAYILTACASKEEFGSFYQTFSDVFHSLTKTTDLFESIADVEKKELLYQKLSNTTDWEDYENFLSKNFADKGIYWQALVLNESKKRIAKTS